MWSAASQRHGHMPSLKPRHGRELQQRQRRITPGAMDVAHGFRHHDRSRPVIAASTSLRWCRMLVFASLRIQARMHEVPPGSNKPNKPNKPRRPAHAPGNTTTSPWSQAGGLDREIGSLGMVVHLHWSRNPKLVRETTLGITVCGVKAPHEQLTAHLADTTCPCAGAGCWSSSAFESKHACTRYLQAPRHAASGPRRLAFSRLCQFLREP